jgi:PadR family transcriptional regulator AphA
LKSKRTRSLNFSPPVDVIAEARPTNGQQSVKRGDIIPHSCPRAKSAPLGNAFVLQLTALANHDMIYLKDIFAEGYMPTGTGGYRHFILGLLTHQPMSGYDIKRFLRGLGWLVGSPSFGVIYPALHTLLKDGLVSVEVSSYENKPPRKVYTITEAGERALREWINRPGVSNASSRAFTMRLILADHLSDDRLIAHLQQRRTQVAEHHTALERANGELDEEADLGQRLALEYGIAVASAELAWLDGILEQLSAQRTLETGGQSVQSRR